jgi:hypothetical protein
MQKCIRETERCTRGARGAQAKVPASHVPQTHSTLRLLLSARSFNRALPTAPLANRVDNLREPFGAVLPVELNSAFRRVWAAIRNRADDLVVLFDGGTQFIQNGTGVEPPIALRLRLRGFMQFERRGPALASTI